MDYLDLQNAGYSTLYGPEERGPVLVREHHVPRNFIDGPDTVLQHMAFREDHRTRPNSLTLHDFDGMFTRYRLTQGHGAARANFRNNFTALRDCYLYSNCWGQHQACNLGPVKKLERYIRYNTDETDKFIKIWTMAQYQP